MLPFNNTEMNVEVYRLWREGKWDKVPVTILMPQGLGTVVVKSKEI